MTTIPRGMGVKRITFVIMDLGGGAGVYCRILASALRKSFPGEFHLSLLVLRDRGFVAEDQETFDEIARIRSSRWGLLGKLLGMRRAMERLRPDAVIAVGSFADVLAPMTTRAPVILTVHGNYSQLMKEARSRWLLEMMLRWRFARGMVVAPAEGVAEDLRENFGAGNVRVIPHGIDAGRIAELAMEPAAGLPEGPYVLAVGRLARQKDYPTLLRGYAAARAQGLNMPLVIVGDGPEEEAMRNLADHLGIAASVQFMGHQDNSFSYMRRAAFLVLASTWEGFGLVLIEAMSLGVPVISTDCPSGPGEILSGGEFGMLVPVGDSEELAQAMLNMADPAVRECYAALARKRSAAFTLERMAVAYRKLLDVIMRT